MPRFDGTGPTGTGPNGRGLGSCGGGNAGTYAGRGGVLQDASVDAAEGADFSAAVLVGAWGRLMRHNPILEQP